MKQSNKNIEDQRVKNHIINLKLNKEDFDLLNEAIDGTGFERCVLLRLFIRKGLRKLKADSLTAGGWDKLEFI